MDTIASIVMLPCNYSTSGCAVSLHHTERREHEETCEFRPYTCPLEGEYCNWGGSLEEVLPHLVKSHESIAILEDEYIKFQVPNINEPGPMAWFCVLSRFGHNFIVVLNELETLDESEQFCVAVELIGTRKQAENFAYKLKLKGQGRRVTWEATTRSIREGFSSITNSDCLVLNACTAQLLADKGELTFNVSISMV
jgi:hypothetical protein